MVLWCSRRAPEGVAVAAAAVVVVVDIDEVSWMVPQPLEEAPMFSKLEAVGESSEGVDITNEGQLKEQGGRSSRRRCWAA